ncbi:hypothetical protein ACFVS2_05015 [Brevibacillus sp. NPDC058079]|uniref:hypothetical protein n=1 Tax=Brevibacillus sp. NPDC058079 TaxID=3346330 RepID=UPI0036E83DAA
MTRVNNKTESTDELCRIHGKALFCIRLPFDLTITFSHFFTVTDFTADNFAELLIETGLKLLPSEEEDYAFLRVFNQFLLSVSQKEKYRDKLRLMQEDFLQGFTSLLERGNELDQRDIWTETVRSVLK